MYDDELLISANPVGTYAKSKGKMMSCECDLKSRGERLWREREGMRRKEVVVEEEGGMEKMMTWTQL